MIASGPSWAAVRHEPYRLFFPMAAVSGLVGVGAWLPYWLGWVPYLGLGHALVQSQAFLPAFVVGFLMTMLPRRLGAPLATTPELLACVAGLAGATVLPLAGQWVAAQLAALLVLGTLLLFAARRFAAQGGAPVPDAFVLLPAGLAMGLVGSVILLVAHAGGPARLVPAALGLVQQAQYLALILGAGHLVLPILTGQVAAPPGQVTGSLRGKALHLLVAAALGAGAMLDRAALPDSAWARGGAALAALAFVADAAACVRVLRPPRVPGLHRRLGWLAFWLVPLGLLLAAAWPAKRVAMLHVTLAGGFALLSFAVATHVIAAHVGLPGVISGSPRLLKVFGACMLLAAATRVSADFLPRSYAAHLGAAAIVWILATVAWLALLGPAAWRGARTELRRDLPIVTPRPDEGDHC